MNKKVLKKINSLEKVINKINTFASLKLDEKHKSKLEALQEKVKTEIENIKNLLTENENT